MTKENLRKIRNGLELTQRQCAENIRCTQGLISMFEIGLVSTDSKKAREYSRYLLQLKTDRVLGKAGIKSHICY